MKLYINIEGPLPVDRGNWEQATLGTLEKHGYTLVSKIAHKGHFHITAVRTAEDLAA